MSDSPWDNSVKATSVEPYIHIYTFLSTQCLNQYIHGLLLLRVSFFFLRAEKRMYIARRRVS